MVGRRFFRRGEGEDEVWSGEGEERREEFFVEEYDAGEEHEAQSMWSKLEGMLRKLGLC